MPYAVTCKACGARFSVGDDLYKKRVAGKFVTINCKSCRAPIRLDGAEAPARRNSSRPPSATRSFPSRPPIPPGPSRLAPGRLPSIQRTQLGGLTARAPVAPSAQARAGAAPQAATTAAQAAAQTAAVRGGPSPPRPRTALGNLPVVVPPVPHHLADAGGEEEATTPFGGFYDVTEESVESVPPSTGPASIDLTDEVEALPPSVPLGSVPLATQLARSRVPHPPKKTDAPPRHDESSADDDPEFLLGLRRATEMPKAPTAAAPAAEATKTAAAATKTAAAATAPLAEVARTPEVAKAAEAPRTAEAPATPEKTEAPKVADVPPTPEATLNEKLQPPLLVAPSIEPLLVERKKSGSAGAVLGLFVLLLGIVGVYRYLNTDQSAGPAEEAEVAAPPEPPPEPVAVKPAEPPTPPTPVAEVVPSAVVPPAPPEPPAEPPPPPAAEPPVAAQTPPAPAGLRARSTSAPATPKPAPAAPAPKPEEKPTSSKPPKPTGPVGPFDRAAAAASLAQASSQASSCKKEGDPSGTTSVTVTFAPSGRVTSATLSGPPFAGTATGSCIASTLRRASVPPFEGERTTVSKTVVIR